MSGATARGWCWDGTWVLFHDLQVAFPVDFNPVPTSITHTQRASDSAVAMRAYPCACADGVGTACAIRMLRQRLVPRYARLRGATVSKKNQAHNNSNVSYLCAALSSSASLMFCSIEKIIDARSAHTARGPVSAFAQLYNPQCHKAPSTTPHP